LNAEDQSGLAGCSGYRNYTPCDFRAWPPTAGRQHEHIAVGDQVRSVLLRPTLALVGTAVLGVLMIESTRSGVYSPDYSGAKLDSRPDPVGMSRIPSRCGFSSRDRSPPAPFGPPARRHPEAGSP